MAKRTIDSLGVRSVARILGVVGLLWGLIAAITWAVAGLSGGPVPGSPEVLVAIVGGALYGVVVGAITAVVCNAAAPLAGGIEIELS